MSTASPDRVLAAPSGDALALRCSVSMSSAVLHKPRFPTQIKTQASRRPGSWLKVAQTLRRLHAALGSKCERRTTAWAVVLKSQTGLLHEYDCATREASHGEHGACLLKRGLYFPSEGRVTGCSEKGSYRGSAAD